MDDDSSFGDQEMLTPQQEAYKREVKILKGIEQQLDSIHERYLNLIEMSKKLVHTDPENTRLIMRAVYLKREAIPIFQAQVDQASTIRALQGRPGFTLNIGHRQSISDEEFPSGNSIPLFDSLLSLAIGPPQR